MIKVCVLGGSGYTGGELLRFFSFHKGVEVTYVTSREHIGKPIQYVHPNLGSFYKGLRFERLDIDLILNRCDHVFISTPLEVSLEIVPKLFESNIGVVDLSPAFRLKDPETFKRYYGIDHPYPDLLEKFVYGLPELYFDKIKRSKYIASPGCNATASILSIAPLKDLKKMDKVVIVIDIKAGSSESGSKPTQWDHHPERASSVRPYSPVRHRHLAEIIQFLYDYRIKIGSIHMIPHAIPIVRGVLASTHIIGIDNYRFEDISRAYSRFYSKSLFIKVYWYPQIVPDIRNVIGTNFAELTVVGGGEGSRVSVFTAIDNMGKGSAGQAIQAFNISAGFEEYEGIWIPPIRPI